MMDKPLSAAELYKAMVRPDLVTGARLPTYPAVSPTCTTQLSGDGEVDVTSPGAYGFLFRDPSYPLWWATSGGRFGGGYTTPASYFAQYGFGESTYTEPGTIFSADIERLQTYGGGNFNAVQSLTAPYVTNTDNFPYSRAAVSLGLRGGPPFAQYPDIDLSDVPFMFAPAGSVVTYTVWTNAFRGVAEAVVNASVVVESVVSGEKENNTNITLTNFAGNIAWVHVYPTKNYWIRPRAATFSTNFTGAYDPLAQYNNYVSIHVGNDTPAITAQNASGFGWGPRVAYPAGPGLSNLILLPAPFATAAPAASFSLKSLNSTMITGVRLTLENISKIMNREGILAAGMLDNTTIDILNSAASPDEAIATIAALPAERRFRCAAEHGIVATVYPSHTTGGLRESLLGFVQTGALNLFMPQMVHRTGDFAAILVCVDPDSATSTSFTMRTNWTWEYITSTQFVKASLSGSNLNALHEATRLAISRPVFETFERGTTMAITNPGRKPAAPTQKPKPKPKARPQQKPAQRKTYPKKFIGPLPKGASRRK